MSDQPSPTSLSHPPRPASGAEPRVWIAWEKQRRSLSLARRVGAKLVLYLDDRHGILRYPLSIAKTTWLLARQRGKIVFVQNPSMVLAAVAGALKGVLGFTLVVDRHSNFAFLDSGRSDRRMRIGELLSNFTLRRADLTIVTNAELAAFVDAAGGLGFVLPDPFPDLSGIQREKPAPATGNDHRPIEILFVASWARDEPIAEVIEACRQLEGEVIVRITGKMKPSFAALVAAAPQNFIPTGFLSDRDYFALMSRSDAVMVITQRAATLVCGGYEAAVMGKPMILGNSAALREYFDRGAVYTDGTADDLVGQIRSLIAGLSTYRAEVGHFLAQRSQEWTAQLASLEVVLSTLPSR